MRTELEEEEIIATLIDFFDQLGCNDKVWIWVYSVPDPSVPNIKVLFSIENNSVTSLTNISTKYQNFIKLPSNVSSGIGYLEYRYAQKYAKDHNCSLIYSK